MVFIVQVSVVVNRFFVFNCNKLVIILNLFLKFLKFNYMIKNSGVVYLIEKKLIDSINVVFFFIVIVDNFFFYIKVFILL